MVSGIIGYINVVYLLWGFRYFPLFSSGGVFNGAEDLFQITYTNYNIDYTCYSNSLEVRFKLFSFTLINVYADRCSNSETLNIKLNKRF